MFIGIGIGVGLGSTTMTQKAIGILRSYGTNAHIYLPGVGTLSGITAGNYLDSAGTTAASVDNPVGLSLDALQAMTLGSELLSGNWQNGYTTSFDTFTSTNPTSFSGTNASTESVRVIAPASFVAGTTYQVTLAGSLANATIASSWVSNSVYGGVQDIGLTSIGQQIIFKAASTADSLMIIFAASSGAAVNAQVSVREIPGIHATQATTANKAILRRGLLNQLTYSQDASNAAWSKISATATASKITEATGSSQHYISQSIDMPDGPVTFAAIFAPAERSWATMYLGSVNSSAWFNSSTGVIGTTKASITASIASLANGYKLCVITGTQTGLGAITRGLYIADADNSNTYTGDGTSGILFGGAGLFQGTYTAQQILDAGGIPLTTSAAASNPNAGKYSWSFDGSNDSLLTGNLGITNTVTVVIAGVLNTLPAVSLLVCEDANGARLGVSSTGAVSFDKNGVAALVATAAGVIVAGVPFVLTARLQAGNADIRKAGAQIATAASALTFSASAGMRIGTRFDGVTYPCNGSIYSVQVITATTTDAECLAIEKMVRQMAGVSI